MLACSYLAPATRSAILNQTIEAAAFPPAFWNEFVRLATDQLIGPALALKFEEHGLSGIVPSLVERYCHAVLRLNRARNARLLREAADLANALNGISVVPLFLKGSAGLLSGLYTDPGLRIMSDLDLLVPADRGQDCERLMAALGYRKAFVGCHPRDTSVGTFSSPDRAAPIDMHCEVLKYPDEGLLRAAEVVADSDRLELEGARLAVPSPTHQVVVNIAHAQLKDHAFLYGQFPMRALYDLALIALRHRGEIDWRDVQDRFASIGAQTACECHCLAAHELLGIEMPPGCDPGRKARMLHRYAKGQTGQPLMQKASSRVMRVLLLLHREMSDPELRLRLLRNMRSAAWWRRHLRIFWEGRRG
jgi:hypothetical protein